MDYRQTLNLPKTDFPMKANLPQREPDTLPKWQKVYASLTETKKSRKKYILHDGPPYANGKIHIGHALNKILKDIIIKYKTQQGFYAPFIPGWDCHGLPVEHSLLKELNLNKERLDQKDFRQKAKDFALKFVDIQRDDFIRLGVWGDWSHPYLTLDPKYEARVLGVLAQLTKAGYIYRGLRPVNWCIECTTALAEAEVEYEDKTSDSIYVRFELKEKLFEGVAGKIDIVVWTTTPWTLISNAGLALHPDLDYILVDSDSGCLIFAEGLAQAVRDKFLKDFKIIRKFKGKALEGKLARHPFLQRDSKIILADFVSSRDGSGCVHIAPGHGEEDFQAGKKYNLEIIMPLDARGFFKEPPEFAGINVKDINKIVIDRLQAEDKLLRDEKISHSYPHCWRCKTPLVVRTTEQWFLNIEHKNLRKKILKAIEKVDWIPSRGKERISSMVSLRPDWCLSRQRLWGIPIPAVKCGKCSKVFLDWKIIDNFSKAVERGGSDVWFTLELKDILPAGFKCECGNSVFNKEKDILDVWFESGASFSAVVKENPDLSFPCDMYLEGSDQHRGWFQASLIPSVALEQKPPFRSVLTHGFVVDGEGRKMSKSLGNIISPQEIIQKYGSDILRLWVAFSDYSEDVRLSDEILKQLIDSYRKIRNTLKFILGNLYDFDSSRDSLKKDKLLEIDRLMLSKTAHLLKEVEEYYEHSRFYKIYQKVYEFCNITLSSFYLDILKDRLYTFSPKSPSRKSAQTVLWHILNFLIKTIAPILSFTAEEAYAYFNEAKKASSVFLSSWPDYRNFQDKTLEDKYAVIFELREKVLKKLEEKRATGLIGSSLEAEAVLGIKDAKIFKFLKERQRFLAEIFITSAVELKEAEDFSIVINRAKGDKCPRCWNWSPAIGEDKDFCELCPKCAQALKKE